MWPWIKRWRDWAMNDLWPFYRVSPQPQAIHYSYEKAGLTVLDQPIPWNAEAVVVDARLRLPASAGRRKSDFQLRLAGRDPVAADDMRRQDPDNHHRLRFRVEPPGVTTTAEVLYKSHVLGQLTLPYLGREEFLQGVRLQLPTLSVRLGNESVACQTFVASQCKGLIATAMLTSPTSLVPLLDMELAVEFKNERGGSTQLVPVRLCSSQLASRHALVTVAPRRFPRRIGSWLVTWKIADQPLAVHRVRAISTRTFERSLRVTDTRFVLRWAKGNVTVARQVPPNEKPARVGPCFLVSSREPGMAGLCQLQVHAQVPGAVQPPLLFEGEALVTDGPKEFAPGTLDMADVAQLAAFELSLKGQPLGVLSLCPAPTAAFTAEGGFKPPHDYAWSAAAEEELNDRLNRLLEGGA
ncbi:MAG TPA: hypothetical protein VFW33_16565 [Gemmataceae bacterium]|nr:hypothetical protein [Gemmataceae bacterium]